MVDQKRRQTLKSITAVATTAAFVPTVFAGVSDVDSRQHSSSKDGDVGVLSIAVRAQPDGVNAVITIENQSASPARLRHVSPGLTRVYGRAFDINAALADGPTTLGPGERRHYILAPLASGEKEAPIPGGVIAKDLVMVTGRYRHAGTERAFRSRRLLLS